MAPVVVTRALAVVALAPAAVTRALAMAAHAR